MPTWLPADEDETEYTMLPDLVVMDIAYAYTGLRDSRGNRILRRVSRPVGFVHHQKGPEYVSEPGTDNDLHEAQGLEGDPAEGDMGSYD
jgi:hypothetical protein